MTMKDQDKFRNEFATLKISKIIKFQRSNPMKCNSLYHTLHTLVFGLIFIPILLHSPFWLDFHCNTVTLVFGLIFTLMLYNLVFHLIFILIHIVGFGLIFILILLVFRLNFFLIFFFCFSAKLSSSCYTI